MPVTATAEPQNTPPRVRVELTRLNGTTVSLFRNDPDGRPRPVRTAEPATLVGGAWTGYDYEAPFGESITYSVISSVQQPYELLTANQSSLEESTTGWEQFGNTTIARSTAAARTGSASMSMLSTASGDVTASTLRFAPNSIPVTPGVTYTATGWFRAATTGRTARLQIAWRDSAGTLIGGYILGTNITDNSTGWTQATVSAAAPANAAYANLLTVVVGCAAAETHYVDDLTFTHLVTDPLISNATTLGPITDPWLIHPGIPDLSVPVPVERVVAFDDRTRPVRSAVLQPLGRSTPLVVSEARSSVTSGITVLTETLDDTAAMWAMLTPGLPILLNVPPDLEWDATYEWVSFGDASTSAPGRGMSPGRIFTLPYTVVSRPAGALTAQWSWVGVGDTYSDLTGVYLAFATYNDLLTNTVTS